MGIDSSSSSHTIGKMYQHRLRWGNATSSIQHRQRIRVHGSDRAECFCKIRSLETGPNAKACDSESPSCLQHPELGQCWFPLPHGSPTFLSQNEKTVTQMWSLGNNQLGIMSLCEEGSGYTCLTPKCTIGHCQRNSVLWLIIGTRPCGATSEDKWQWLEHSCR